MTTARALLDRRYPVPKAYADLVARCESLQEELLSSGASEKEVWTVRYGVSTLDLGEGRLFAPRFNDHYIIVPRWTFSPMLLAAGLACAAYNSFEACFDFPWTKSARYAHGDHLVGGLLYASLAVGLAAFGLNRYFGAARQRRTLEKARIRRTGIYILPDRLFLLDERTAMIPRSSLLGFSTSSRFGTLMDFDDGKGRRVENSIIFYWEQLSTWGTWDCEELLERWRRGEPVGSGG